ncbi:hypothetical protein NG99_22275 [Erwinia typographi]|uniref:Uncharacterized protein n=1 Tax=Erwinia typographi TaxID=371042 RepID=A0A0A3YN98_9GAMM|nr:hypothetical protein NG99_22275 [Erwinia typographi]
MNRKIYIFLITGVIVIFFIIMKLTDRTFIENAECLISRESADFMPKFMHFVQLVYRVVFETCDHDYR